MADTIAAIATGNVISAIGIIRMSGDDAIKIAAKVFRSVRNVDLEKAENRKLYYGYLLDKNGNNIDLCLCTISRGPHSYTGENTAEFQCHGSPVVLAEGLSSLFAAGARQAGPGEFTKRAFLNGCMDLSQAEAVIDIIEAETSEAAQNAVGQLDKAVSIKTDAIYDDLCDIMAHFHAVLDYPDEDIEDFQLESYKEILDKDEKELKYLLSTYDRGKIMKEGIKCAVIGKPNVGKSSLLNALVGYERAIVTDIAGTTRDTIEEKIRLGKTVLRLVDTAGIHKTEDKVEKIGVDRAMEAASDAQLVIAVFDGSCELTDEDMFVIEQVRKANNGVILLNKSDKDRAVINMDAFHGIKLYEVSAKTGDGIDEFCKAVEEMFAGGPKGRTGEIITNARQAGAIGAAVDAIASAKAAMEEGLTPDCVLVGVEQAMMNIGEISGKTIREDITARIFERFCVGK